MTDPRTPQKKDAGLPDPLDQTPGEDRPAGTETPKGSEDAQLLAEAEASDGDVEGAQDF